MTDAARLAALAAISRMQKEADLARLAGAPVVDRDRAGAGRVPGGDLVVAV